MSSGHPPAKYLSAHPSLALVGGPELKFLPSKKVFPLFSNFSSDRRTKNSLFSSPGVGWQHRQLWQFCHQQPVLQIDALAHSPACNTGSRGEMLRQSHWKTQIEGLTKRQFVQVSVHRARVCIRSVRRDKCSCFSLIFYVLSSRLRPLPCRSPDSYHGQTIAESDSHETPTPPIM